MKFEIKHSYKLILAIAISAVVSFFVGVRYEQIDRHRQEIMIFANVLGDELVNTNRLLDSLERKSKEEAVQDYNLSTLNDIGCSTWLKYLDHFETEDLKSFNAGVDFALARIEVAEYRDNDCVRKLQAMRE